MIDIAQVPAKDVSEEMPSTKDDQRIVEEGDYNPTEAKSNTTKKSTPLAEQVLINLNVINGAIWGALARKGLQVLTTFDGSINDSAVWANFAACLILGFLSKHEKTPFVVGLTTGFCGTLSSFSAVALDMFYKSTNTSIGIYYNYPNPAYGIMQFISVILIEIGVSIFGYHMGKHFAVEFPLKAYHHQYLAYFCAALGIATYIVAIVLIGTVVSWRSWMFLIFFVPYGALIRFHLAKFNKVEFPLGTFIVNVAGSASIAIFSLLARAKNHNSSSNLISSTLSCNVFMGLIDGFCGALTTISTFIAEIFVLPKLTAYFYTISCLVISYVIVLLILGPYNWTVGLTDPICL